MTSPVPHLIDLATASQSPSNCKPSTSNHLPSQIRNDPEEAIDIFSTLFSPATPRPSPTLAPITIFPFDNPTNPRPAPHSRQQFPEPRSADSDFGSFVSVPATEDPLSILTSLPGPDLPLPHPIKPSQSPPSSSNHSNARRDHTQNASLSFFDKFAQDAKRASEINRRGYLDELLFHEDDPLYWLKDQAASESSRSESKEDTPENGAPKVGANEQGDVLPSESGKGHQHTDERATTDPSTSLLDLDFDFFTSKPTTNIPPEPEHQQPPLPRRTSRTFSTSFPQSPTSTLPSLPTLAPPLASTPSVSSSPSMSTIDQSTDTSDTTPSLAPRSASYQTLTNISSRWMSSLLAPSPSDQQSASSNTVQDKTPNLESMFVPPPRPASSDTSPQHQTARPSFPATFPSRRKIPTPTPSHPTSTSHPHPHAQPHHPTPHRASAFSLASASLPTQISHGTPFGPSSHIATSPFAAHVYVPPSGAPGFKGEEYDWDRGFSQELERELSEDGLGEGRNDAKHGEKELLDFKQGRGNVKQVAAGVGGLIEKRSGGVELKGRKEGTTKVLGDCLASLIRPHLPALSRLPRAWTLLYSLDQHGISLNTLYTRCEAQKKASPGARTSGALVVMKDANDGLFGAWMGEGVELSRGRGYYGSGESFLWKDVAGELEVFNWTGKNDYVTLCEPEFISFGGGDGNYGLYLDDSLFDGTSASCPTFDNEPLCSSGQKKGGAVVFECVGLEVWGIGP